MRLIIETFALVGFGVCGLAVLAAGFVVTDIVLIKRESKKKEK